MIDENKIKQSIAAALKAAPLSISSTRRQGSNGLRNADEIADLVIQALIKELPKPAPYYGDDPIKLQEQIDAYTRIGLDLIAIGDK